MNREGISAIVATVLIILITISGVAIIWIAIIPMISENIAFEEMEGRVSIVSNRGYTVYDVAKEIAIVQVKRDVDEGVMDRIEISFFINGNSVSSKVMAPESGGLKTYIFNLSAYGEPESVGVAPIFASGDLEKVGSMSSKIKIPVNTIGAVSGLVYDLDKDYSHEFVVQVKTSESNGLHYDIDDFESGGSDLWNARNTIIPDITSSTVYSGSSSLHMPSGWGRNFERANNIEAGQTSAGYNTKDYPYMCMAYRIPVGTINNMLITISGVGWRSITMTQCENPVNYPKVASWNPLIVDDAWHYTCINLDEQLDASLGAGDHTIVSVIWHNGGGCSSAITGEFWIDDFVIAKNPYYIG
jgi:hypothetical protein